MSITAQPKDIAMTAAQVFAAWQPIETAPQDDVLLLYGTLRQPGLTGEHPRGAIRAVGYWDEIDQAWALSDTTWDGPFFNPTHWMPCPPIQQALPGGQPLYPESVAFVHLYPQFTYHRDARIVANIAGLQALAAAIATAIETGCGVASVSVIDGEGYRLRVERTNATGLKYTRLPYHPDYGGGANQ